MSTTHPQFTARIEGAPETIFELIADMPNYGRWLSGSDAFGGTTEVKPYPVRLGTTYLDAGPAGQRPGSVTEYDPPKHIAFPHTMVLKKGPLGANIAVDIRYTFEPQERSTFVIRQFDLTIKIPGLLKVAEPLVIWVFRKENVRILAELRRYVEAQAKARDLNTSESGEPTHEIRIWIGLKYPQRKTSRTCGQS
jgi:uncharacterized protein YndB with AHSA1/START domain